MQSGLIVAHTVSLDDNSPLYRYSASTLAANTMSSREIILIYQMGKVGSQTVERTVRAIKPDAQIVRTHFLTPHQYDWLLWDGASDMPPAFKASVEHQKREALATLEVVRELSRGARLKLITGCREPVAQCISGAFQNISSLLPEYAQLSVDECVHEMRHLLLSSWRAMEHGVAPRTSQERLLETLLRVAPDWFDQELRAVFGIDIYTVSFRTWDMPLVFARQGVDVLLYRLEDGVRGIREGLARLLGGSVTVQNENLSSAKDYNEAYLAFRRSPNLPQDFLDERYGSRYARHFYDPDEIHAFRQAWSTATSPAEPL